MTITQSQLEFDAQASPPDALASGTVLLNGQYTIDHYLASGGFGITYLARDSLDRRVVIKECFPEAICTRTNVSVTARSQAHLKEYHSSLEMFIREARSIAKLNHPSIVGVHQIFEDNDTAYMALDYVNGQDLLDTIEAGPLTMRPDEVKRLLLKILHAISTVHSHDMLHRDISPDNILIDASGAPVLIDFGAAREEASKKTRALSSLLMVKDGYSPQEFYTAGSKQTACSDLYALGATFFHLITGSAPPDSQTRVAAIAQGQPDPYVPLAGRMDDYDHEFLVAIDKSMNIFPKDRIQTAQDWITCIDDERRRQTALDAARQDEQINKTVTDLVSKSMLLPEPVFEPVPPAATKKPALPANKPVTVAEELEPEPDTLSALAVEECISEDDEDAPDPDPSFDLEAQERISEAEEEGLVSEGEDDAPEAHSEDSPATVTETPVLVKHSESNNDIIFRSDISTATSHPWSRQVAISVIAWAILISMFMGWPSHVVHSVKPVFEKVLTFSPASADETFAPVQR